MRIDRESNEVLACDSRTRSLSAKMRELLAKMIGRLRSVSSKMLRSFKTRFVLVRYRIQKSYVGQNRFHKQFKTSEKLFSTSECNSANQWIFHDENWIRVIHRREHRRIIARGRVLSVVDNFQEPTGEVSFEEGGTIYFNGRTATNDEWIYLELDSSKYAWDNYSWRFRIRRDTDFREFQLGFRYQDFYNRYRYRFENGHIYFDKVIKGKFLNAFGATPFGMKPGVWYDVRIDIFENHFRCYVDGILMLDGYDFQNSFPKGSIAVILWECNGVTDIVAAVGPISVHRLVSFCSNE